MYVVNLKLSFIKSSTRSIKIVKVNTDIWECSKLYCWPPTNKNPWKDFFLLVTLLVSSAFKVLAFGPIILESLPKHIKWQQDCSYSHSQLSFKTVAAMELKILFITVLFLGASAGFSLREEQEGKPTDSWKLFYGLFLSLVQCIFWFVVFL